MTSKLSRTAFPTSISSTTPLHSPQPTQLHSPQHARPRSTHDDGHAVRPTAGSPPSDRVRRRQNSRAAHVRHARRPATPRVQTEETDCVGRGEGKRTGPRGTLLPDDRDVQGHVRCHGAVLQTAVGFPFPTRIETTRMQCTRICNTDGFWQLHHLLSFREGSHLAQIPWRARPATVPIWRGALHCLQAM